MAGKGKLTDDQLTPEELKRRNLIRKRCLGVLIGMDVLMLVYLIVQIILVLMKK